MGTIVIDDNYTVEVDRVSAREWNDIIQGFDDSIIYQTWPWGGVRWGWNNVSHIVLKKGAEAIAAAQCWIMTVPLFGWGIAYVKCGPMWRRNNAEGDREEYRTMIRALKSEYAERRGLLLRVMPNVVDGRSEEVCSILTAEGFTRCAGAVAPYRTLVLDLTCSAEDLRKGLSKPWRSKLKRTEDEPFQIAEDASTEAFDAFAEIYEETRLRKNFEDNLDVGELRRISELLPDEYKIKIFVCSIEGEKMGGALVCPTGKTAILLLTGNTAKGLELLGSYCLTWHVANRMKALGCHWFDLAGIDPERCPGTYQFKKGFAGKLGKDITFDNFDYCQSVPSRLATRAADHLRRVARLPNKLLLLNNRTKG